MIEAKISIKKAFLFLLVFAVWGLLTKLAINAVKPDLTQLTSLLLAKGSLAVLTVIMVFFYGGFRQVGFRGVTGYWFVIAALPFLALTAGVLLNPEAAFGLTLFAASGWFLVALAVGINEEVMFRGILWRAFEGQGTLTTAIATSLLFGAIHMLGLVSDVPAEIILSQCVFAAGGGMVFAAVRVSSNSIVPPILFHTIFDAAAFIAAGGVKEMFDDTLEPSRLIIPGAAFFVWGLVSILISVKRRNARPS